MSKHKYDNWSTNLNKRAKPRISKGPALMDVAQTLEWLANSTNGEDDTQLKTKEFCDAVNNASTRLKECLNGADSEDLQDWADETNDTVQFLTSKLLSNCGTIARFSNVQLTAESIEFILKQLRGSSRVSNSLAKMSFQGLNMLVKAGKVYARNGLLFRSKIFNELADDLITLNPVDHRVVYHFMSCLASLSKAKLLEGQLNMHSLSLMLREIPRNNGVPYSNLTIPIHDLGILAINNRIDGEIDASDLLSLLSYRYEPDHALSSNMIYGISALIINQSIYNVSLLGPSIDQILGKFTKNTVSPENAHQCLMGIETLWSNYKCDIKHIKLLLEKTQEHLDLNEDKIISYINNYFLRFKEHHAELNGYFQTLLAIIPYHLTDATRHDLRKSADNLAGYGTWGQDLRAKIEIKINTNNNNNNNNLNNIDWPSPIPEPSPVEEHVNQFLNSVLVQISFPNQSSQQAIQVSARVPVQMPVQLPARVPVRVRAPAVVAPVLPDNAIYKAIASNNMTALMQLLKVTVNLFQPQNHNESNAKNKTAHRFFANPESTHQQSRIWHDKNTEQLVIEFFQNIPATNMRELIEESKHKYFDILIRALSPHQRYQLAIKKCFSPLMMYLPFNQLSPMVNDFIERGLYIDHDALMQLICDLRARRTQEQGNKVQKIIDLEKRLLGICFAHHVNAKHMHVKATLQEFLDDYKEPTSQPEDIDDDEDYDISDSKSLGR